MALIDTSKTERYGPGSSGNYHETFVRAFDYEALAAQDTALVEALRAIMLVFGPASSKQCAAFDEARVALKGK